MSTADIKEVVNLVMEFDWQLAVGIGMAIIFFGVGILLLLKKPPEKPKVELGMPEPEPEDPRLTFYRTWRPLILGLLFVVLGCVVSGGAKKIGSSLLDLACPFLVVAIVIWAFRASKKHLRNMPVLGQTWHMPGVGEVRITTVHARADITYLLAEVMFEDISEQKHRVPVHQFMQQATLLPDKEVEAPEENEIQEA